MELIIVVVVIGVLAAVALPSYRIQMLKMKNQEAIRVLLAVWEVQKEYYRDNDGAYAMAIGLLPIDIPTLKYFQNLSFSGVPASCTGPAESHVAFIDSMDSVYRLYMLEDGRIVCAPAGVGPCPGSLCTKMGFPDW